MTPPSQIHGAAIPIDTRYTRSTDFETAEPDPVPEHVRHSSSFGASHVVFTFIAFTGDGGPHVRIRADRGCRRRGLPRPVSISRSCVWLLACCAGRIVDCRHIAIQKNVPGPLTLRMIERDWSSMNSTRTWVTPPREPIVQKTPY